MVYLFVETINPDKAKVGVIHYRPDLLNVEQKKKAIVVERVPDAIVEKGKSPQLYINPKTKDMWYEYEDRPLSEIELLQEISEKLTELINRSN